MITPNEYQQAALSKEADQDKIRHRIYNMGVQATRLDNAARGLADDCGELNSAVKKWLEYGQELDEVNVLEEIGDCLWRLAQASAAIGRTLEDAMLANLRKLNVRYGDGICEPERAVETNRNRDAERRAVEQGE